MKLLGYVVLWVVFVAGLSFAVGRALDIEAAGHGQHAGQRGE